MTRGKRAELKQKIASTQKKIHESIVAVNATIGHRTQANNRKSAYNTIEEERAARADITEAQIKAWRSLLPTLIKKFSRIPDPRRATSVKHKLVVLMVFGLLAFIFRLSSRREINRELTGAAINSNLQKIFPELESVPHADTLARTLKKTNPNNIEAAHIGMIKNLISNKKLKTLLINGGLSVTIDGTQKLYRDGLLKDERWLQLLVGNAEDENYQQYVYVIEANITLKNGLNVPLMTEYLFMDNNQLANPNGKQDCEITAFERLVERLKSYFPRLKLILFMDALYATQGVMGLLHDNHWDYIISLPKNKLKEFAKILNKEKQYRRTIPGQKWYRGRQQSFYWENNIEYGHEYQLKINLVACFERWEVANKATGEIEVKCSEHAWISSVPMSIDKIHELLNCGARKKELIEDSINTEKNRGYKYKHAFSYNWNTMQGFHYLMRLGHAINALSEFTKKLKKYIKANGVSATLKFIKETLFGPWLPSGWYEEQTTKVAQLRFQLE